MIALHQIPLRRISRLLACAVVVIACVTLVKPGTAQDQVDESQQLAALLGLEPSEYGYLLSADPLSTDDNFLQLALTRLGEQPFRRLPTPSGEWDSSSKSIRITGSVEHLIRHRFKPQEFDDISLDGAEKLNVGETDAAPFYECLIRLDSSDSQPPSDLEAVRVLTPHVPRLWQMLSWQPASRGEAEWKPGDAGTKLRASAVVINLGRKQWALKPSAPNAPDGPSGEESSADNAEPRILTGVAKRLEWPESSTDTIMELLRQKQNAEVPSETKQDQPAKASDEEHHQQTANQWAGLGSVGFDLGLWDVVAIGQRRPLQPFDNEPFYQLLAASRRWPSAPGIALPIRDLIREPQSWVGHSFAIHVTIKQVTKVPSDSGDRASQLGISEYYLLHGVIPLDRPLKLKFDGEKHIEYRQHFPVVIATAKLPEGMAVGDNTRQWVEGQGRMFKLWSYQSLRSQDAGVDQFAPLLVTGDLRLAGAPVHNSRPWFVTGLFLIPVGFGLLFLLVFGLWSLRRRS